MNKSMLFTLTAQMMLAIGCATLPQGKVVKYPAPAGLADSSEYQVTVDGKPVDIYPCNVQFWDGKYYFGSFDFEGEVTVMVTSPKSLANVEIQPARFGIRPVKVSDDTIVFKADKPFRISIEREGRVKPLLLFGNPIEKNVPKQGDANVLYFGPGHHKVGRLDVKAGQTVYLAGGAVLSGGIEANGDNITIRGRGIVDGMDYPRFKGPCAFPVHTVNGKNITIEGITIRNAWSWTLVTNNCRNVLIDNVKVVCSNMINDDAVDLCNTSDAIVRNCFLRCQDDNIAIKGLDAKGRAACENILVEDCEFWTDCANTFRIGYECESEAMRNIRARNIDVLYYSKNVRGPDEFWANVIFWLQPSGGMEMYDLHFEDIRVKTCGLDTVVVQAKAQCCGYSGQKYQNAGSLRDVTFKDISIDGVKDNFKGIMNFQGRNEKETISGITLENVTYFGEKITRESPCVMVREFASDINFK